MDLSQFWFQSAGGASYQIDNSLRFRGAQQLSRTPASASNRKTWTISCWVKYAVSNGEGVLWMAGPGAYEKAAFKSGTPHDLSWAAYTHPTPGYHFQLATNQQFRDPAAWFHCVFVSDTDNGTAADRKRLYINGERVTSWATQTNPSPGYESHWNSTQPHRIGADSNPFYFNGYVAEFHSVDGTALSPTDFGEFNADGVWVPKAVSGVTYGTNGFYLDFSDPSNIGADRKGSGAGFGNWYGSVSGSNYSGSWENVLNGIADTFDEKSYIYWYGQNSTLTFATPISGVIEVFGSEGGNNVQNDGNTVTLSDGSLVSFDGVRRDTPVWRSFGAKSNITTIKGTGGGVSGLNVGAIRVDGEILWQANDFTPTGFELTDTTSTFYDLMEDSPTDNFSTLNPLNAPSGVLSEANLCAGTGTSNSGGTVATFAPSSGRWYWEFNAKNLGNATFGVSRQEFPVAYGAMRAGVGASFSPTLNEAYINNSTSSPYIATGSYPFPSNGAYMCAWDADARRFWLGVNGTWYARAGQPAGDPAAGTNPFFDETQLTAGSPFAPVYGGSVATTTDGCFNTGNRPLSHTPPTGFQPLSTAMLPDVDITNPSDHFQTILAPGDQILSPRSELTAEPAAATSFTLNSGNLSWAQSGDGSILFANELICGNQQILKNDRTVGGSNTPSYNGQDYIEFDPPLTLTGNCFVRWGNTTAGNGTERGPSIRITYGDNTVVTSPQLGRTIDYPNTTTTYGNYVINNRLVGTYTLDNTKTLKRIELAAGMSARYASNLNLLVIDDNPVIANSQTLDVANGSLFSNGDIVISTVDNKSGVVTAAGATSITVNSLSDWNGTYASGEGVYKHLCAAAGLGPFENGLAWVKDRANTNQHQLVDSVRGGNLALNCPTFGVQTAYAAPAGNSVAWCWNLVPDRSNGFDIVTWAGDNADNRRIPHNLGAVPEFQIAKCIDSSDPEFLVAYTGIPSGQTLVLNRDYALVSGVSQGVLAPPDSDTTFGTITGTSGRQNINQNGLTYISYLWRSVPGYSSMGSYSGTGNRDAAFVYTGFRPAFLLTKSTSIGDWQIRDSARGTYNPVSHVLIPNSTNQEGGAASYEIDLLSNGFKIRGDLAAINGAGQTILYMAFAEHPFGGSNVSPSPAR